MLGGVKMKNIFKYLISLLFLFSTFSTAQSSSKITLDINVSVIGDRAKVFEDQLKSYIQNELLKIPDVKITTDNPAYNFYVSIFQLPCDCERFDYYYRAHFLSNKKIFKDSHISISEGFDSYNKIEELAKILVANLNANYLSELRN